MRVRFPYFVLKSVRDEQWLTGPHDGLAIRSRIESARLARISFGRAGDENFDVGRIGPHYGGRGHVHYLGEEIHKLLPFSDDFRGHFDRMCHARAAILRLRSGPFSVDTPVHAEQFLGLDGEGSKRLAITGSQLLTTYVEPSIPFCSRLEGASSAPSPSLEITAP